MDSPRENFLNDASREAAEIIDEVVQELLEDEFATPVGAEEVGSRELRRNIRLAMIGDEQAMRAVAQMAIENGHTQDGDGCPACQEVAQVLGALTKVSNG